MLVIQDSESPLNLRRLRGDECVLSISALFCSSFPGRVGDERYAGGVDSQAISLFNN